MNPNYHALIVDDNVRNVVILAQLLADQGISHTPVTNSAQLGNTIGVINDLSVAFVDLEMPGLDGYDVLTLLKSDPRFENVPVVCYTVHVSEINAAHARGFDGFIAKPIDPDRFPDQLARVLRHEPVWETA